MSLLYRSLRQFLRVSADLYFTDIESTGRRHVPESGPVIFAANHPNSIMDSVILGTQIDRQLHYLARSGLFDNPLAAFVFDRCGVIPIHRSPQGSQSNRDAFESAFEVLANGRCIGIFPEGQNAPERRVLRIKTGTARIALGAERAHDYGLGVQVVPVGLNFENRDRFLSQVLVRFGEPIDALDWAQAHRRDEGEAVRQFTDAISEQIHQLATHIEGERTRELVEHVYRIYGKQLLVQMLDDRTDSDRLESDQIDELEDLAKKFAAEPEPEDALKADGGRQRRRLRSWLWDAVRSVDRGADDLEVKLWVQGRIADAVDYYQKRDPELVRRMQLRIWQYVDHVRQVRLKHDVLEGGIQHLSRFKESVKLTAYAIGFAPLALWGLVHNFVPYQLTRLAALKAPDEAMRAFTALATGAVLFPLFYALYGAGLWWASDEGALFVTLYLGSLVPAGFFFLPYRLRVLRYRDRILVRTLFRTETDLVEDLLRERDELVEIFDELRRRFREAEKAGEVEASAAQ